MVFMKAFSATAVGFVLLLSGQNPGAILPVETALSSDKVEVPVRAAVSQNEVCLLYTSPSPRDATLSRMPSSA